MAAWRQELNAALDKKLTTLRTLLSSSAGLWVGLRGGALWEGLVAMYSSRRWEVLRDICQYFYQVCLRNVNHIIVICYFFLDSTVSSEL